MFKPLHHRQAIGLLILAMTAGAGLSGCQGTSRSVLTHQGVKFTIIRPGSTTSKMQTETRGGDGNNYAKTIVSWAGSETGEVVVVLENLRLQVDGQDYGLLKAGDTVTVDTMKGGKVIVNDQERQPLVKKES